MLHCSNLTGMNSNNFSSCGVFVRFSLYCFEDFCLFNLVCKVWHILLILKSFLPQLVMFWTIAMNN